jgi:redox-sensitive bicupin YhaK (pirin superfamily)
VEDLRYKMIMALNAADIGNPICEQAAEICAEIAEQYCAELHAATTTAQLHDGESAIRIKNSCAELHAARLRPGEVIELPEAPFLHLFVPRGTVTLEGAGPLSEGDAVRLTATGGQEVTATEPAEVLLWEMHATIAGW